MSAARSAQAKGMKQNYDKLVVMIVLVVLLVSSLFLVLQVTSNRKKLADESRAHSASGRKDVEPLDVSVFAEELARIKNPPPIGTHSNYLAVSELRVLSINPENVPVPIPFHAEVCWLTQHPQPPVETWDMRDTDGDGIRNRYEKEHGLDPENAADAALDSDGDGFSNIEEYTFETDMSDPEDYPALPAKLRLVGVKRTPFVLRFQGIQEMPGGGRRFLLNLRSLERSYFAVEGQDIEGYKVVGFLPDAPDGVTLVLERRGEKIRLVKGVKIDKFEVVAGLVFLLDQSTYRVRVGDGINLKAQKYKIVDIKRNAVSIRDVESGKLYRIEPLSDREKRELRGDPEEPSRPFNLGEGAPPMIGLVDRRLQSRGP